jgi:hypothetical protein
MPQLLVVTDLPEDGGEVVYRERVASSDFESRHFAEQLAERLDWAVKDANELSSRAKNLAETEPTAERLP